jgi:mRNA interferase RelE/StbE
MARCRVELTPAAECDLNLDPQLARRVLRVTAALAENPRPSGFKRLRGTDLYRIRVGDYRVVYGVDDAHALILIVRVRHRREVYR